MTSYAVLMDVHGAYVSQISLHTTSKHPKAGFGAIVVACCIEIISGKINLSSQFQACMLRKYIYYKFVLFPSPCMASNLCISTDMWSFNTMTCSYKVSCYSFISFPQESDVISDDHELALTTISIIGCLTALICYVILFCTFYFIRYTLLSI